MTDVAENLLSREEGPSNSKIKKINNLLNSSQTRISGLELLGAFLPECCDKDYIEWCISWMHHCCKIDGSTKARDISIVILNELLKISSNYSELKKSVSFFITTRFFDHFFKYYKNSQAGWSCAQTCLLLYKGACGPFQGAVAEHLSHEVDKPVKILPIIAQCCALVPCLGGGGHEAVNYKTNWTCHFMKYVKVCHSILSDLFVDVVEELQEFDTDGYSYNKKNVEINGDFLTVQLHNYCAILSFMLLNKYPAPKCIPTDVVLQMICRGLAVNPWNLGQNRTTNVIFLQKLLPEVHSVLHSLLRALVVTCRAQLLPYAYVIAKLIRQTLEWTDGEYVYGSDKPFASLRISAYDTLCNWLAATGSGSCVETISKVVVSNVVGDIQSKKTSTLLKESKRKGQGEVATRRRVDSSANCVLCYTALKALQFVIKFVGVSLKVEEHKFLQEVVIRLLVNIQNSSTSDILIPYSVPSCRMELYCLLLELIHQPCMGHPPPTHFALQIFCRGQNDATFAVSDFCTSAINVITSIIHSQFDNGAFGVAATERVRREVTPQWGSMAREAKSQCDGSLGREIEKSGPLRNAENDVDYGEVALEGEDWGENLRNQDESDVPSCEDSTDTVNYCKSFENEKDIVEIMEEENVGEATEKHPETTQESENEPATKKSKSEKSESSLEEKALSPVTDKEPKSSSPLEAAEQTRNSTTQKQTPKKDEGKPVETEDSSSVRSMSSESPGDDRPRDPRKRYFLRSKTCKASSEEPEGTASPESFRTPTPNKGPTKTTSTLTLKKRPRTRALSKIKDEHEETSYRKEELDEDEDIIESFHDSFVD